MADVTLTYKGSDILELSDSGSATLKTGGKYCEDDIAVEYVKPSGGGVAPVTSLILHTGNVFDFGMQLNPSIHRIRPLINNYSFGGSLSTGMYCSLSGGNAFFAIAGRNGNYNRWQYGSYGSDNFFTGSAASFAAHSNPLHTMKNVSGLRFAISFIGNGSIGSESTEVPQTETLLHVASGFNGCSIYSFSIYDKEQSELLLYWIPALDSNGVPCFYDCVNEKFVYNIGTGELGYTLEDAI